MKKIFITIVLLFLLAACAPAATVTPADLPQPSQTLMATDQPTATIESTPTEQSQAEPTKKPKGQNQLPAPTSTNPDFVATEILGRPTDTSITVNVIPAVDMEVVITYGAANGAEQTVTAIGKANTPQEIQLSNLQSDTEYFYSVNGGAQHTFHTARAQGSTFTFAIQGDSHPERVKKQFNADLYTKTLLSAASIEPDFYMTIGDDFSVDSLKNVNAETVTAQYINQRQWLGLADAPVFLVNGNHEQAALANLDGTPDNVAVWAANARNAYYPQPAPDSFYTGDAEPVEHIGFLRDYYAFTWGDALFVVIDPYWHSTQTVDNMLGDGKPQQGQKQKRDLWEVTLGDAQYQWFRQTLETSNAKYKFVFAHHVNGTGRGGIELANTFEWGDAANLSAHRTWDKTIHQVMADSGVTIFFQGHDHIFVKQELDGVIYQSLPTPADPNYAFDNAEAYKTGDKFPASGHVRVTVSPDGVTVDYVRSYLDKPDEVAFTYTIP
ncbi:MAG: metallophosphoesterase [Chloroflexi bacterium]|nr:metallophosphoesterase [Chloroflexota bacterium]